MPDTKDDPTPDDARSAEAAIGQEDSGDGAVSGGGAVSTDGDSRPAPETAEEAAAQQAPEPETTSERLVNVQESIDTAKDSAQQALPDR